ncbi:MAG: hypothetical protein ACRDJU_01430, partial [Actinomycetota bacterium]
MSEVVPLTEVQLDQTLRNAIGVQVNSNRVSLTSIEGPTQRLLDSVNGAFPRRFVVMRAQTADIVIMEKGACAIPPLVMDLLGITSGDVVVLEGVRHGASEN